MDFELQEWKVERESADLTNQLFGSFSEGKAFLNSQKSLKGKEQSKKRKLDKQRVSDVNDVDTGKNKNRKKKTHKSLKVNSDVESSPAKSLELINSDNGQQNTEATKAGKKKKHKKTEVKGNADMTESDGFDKTNNKDDKKVKIGKKRRLKEDDESETKSTNKKRKFSPKEKLLPADEGEQSSVAETAKSSACENVGKTKKRKKVKKGSSKRNKYKHLDDARRLEREKMSLENCSVDSGNGKDNSTKQGTPLHSTNNKLTVASSEKMKQKGNKILEPNSKQGTLKGKKKNKTKQEKQIDKPKFEIEGKGEMDVNRKSKHSVNNKSEHAVNSKSDVLNSESEHIVKYKNKFSSKSKNKEGTNNKKAFESNKKVNSPFNVSVLRNVLSTERESTQNLKQTTNKNKTVNHRENTNKKVDTKEGSFTTQNMKQLTLKEKMMNQLNSARFRYINEQLYTQTGEEARLMFESDGESYKIYHEGFHNQVQKWPTNPVDVMIQQIKAGPKNHVIADFGCGDAKIARSVKQKVHSFDLVALNDHVTSCDMAHVPLADNSVNVAVFCLSLMGTNLNDYLLEANRVMKPGGTLKVAEVTSRFSSIPRFIVTVEKFGFRLINQDTSNKMFVSFDFKKKGAPKGTLPELSLHPCVYKRR